MFQTGRQTQVVQMFVIEVQTSLETAALYQTHILHFPKAQLKCFYRITHIYPLPLNPCINSKSSLMRQHRDKPVFSSSSVHTQPCSGHSSICQTTACSQTTEWETLQLTNEPPFILPAKAQDKNTLLYRIV